VAGRGSQGGVLFHRQKLDEKGGKGRADPEAQDSGRKAEVVSVRPRRRAASPFPNITPKKRMKAIAMDRSGRRVNIEIAASPAGKKTMEKVPWAMRARKRGAGVEARRGRLCSTQCSRG